MRPIIVVLAWFVALGGCGGAASSGDNPCLTVCNKRNSCLQPGGGNPVPCAAICVYGGNYAPGLAPAPVCPALAAQKTCVAAAVTMSCNTYQDALGACPPCSVLDGSPCASDLDCQKYSVSFRCDLGRPGGYCTAPCQVPDDCSAGGPEICGSGKAPSFSPQSPATQSWCLLGCRSDNDCRAAEGYRCVGFNATAGFGVCDRP